MNLVINAVESISAAGVVPVLTEVPEISGRSNRPEDPIQPESGYFVLPKV